MSKIAFYERFEFISDCLVFQVHEVIDDAASTKQTMFSFNKAWQLYPHANNCYTCDSPITCFVVE